MQKNYSLQTKVFRIFLEFWCIVFLTTMAVSFIMISKLTRENIFASVQNKLSQAQLEIETVVANLDYTSQQLAYNENVLHWINKYKEATQPYYKAQAHQQIKSILNLLSLSNMSVKLVVFYEVGSSVPLYNNFEVIPGLNFENFPVLLRKNDMIFYGPHLSISKTMRDYVISVNRYIQSEDGQDICVYIEYNMNPEKGALNSSVGRNDYFFYLEKPDGTPLYSEKPEVTDAIKLPLSQLQGRAGDYYWFRSQTGQTYSIAIFMEEQAYHLERNRWLVILFCMSGFFLILGLIFSYVLYHYFYSPLKLFSRAFDTLLNRESVREIQKIGVLEFDTLLDQSYLMKARIQDLIEQVRRKEKDYYKLKYKTLIYQINPHFIMNTLNTLHWMALDQNQLEIDQIAQALNRMLQYNLGNERKKASLQDELDIVQFYLKIQQYRYEFSFSVEVADNICPADIVVPKFILQPLAENALFHGVEEQGIIRIQVDLQQDFVRIMLFNTGNAMDPSVAEEIRASVDDSVQHDLLGIGLSYVKHSLFQMYGEKGKLDVEPKNGGTCFWIYVPWHQNPDEKGGSK
ncbi:MAG: sensor histidine kinase [Candidatus Merdivicinus sp.]|jgi:two-component system sensor histidine kinase YesM